MKGGKTPLGYTIIEVMIVLVISGVMFLIAANFISGRQAKASFTAGVNEMASRIQDTIEQVNDGHYTDRQFSCSQSITGPQFSVGAHEQGGSEDCVFLGKFYHFDRSPSAADKYEIFSLAGNRLVPGSTSQPAIDLADIIPTPIAPPYIPVPPPNIDLTEQQIIPQHLKVAGLAIYYDAGTAGACPTPDFNTCPVSPAYGFGFLQGVGSLDSSGNLASGAQNIGIVWSLNLNNGAEGQPEPTAAQNLKGQIKAAVAARVCVTDGSEFAGIFVGLAKSRLSIKVLFHGKAGCGVGIN